MKLLYLVFIIAAQLGTLSAQAPAGEQSNDTIAFQPPKNISDKFKKECHEITPTWYADENYYVAEFTDTVSLKGRAIVYDKNANVVRREKEVENATYPRSINDYFVTAYPGVKFRTWKSLDNKGIERYCIRKPEVTLWFDKQGKYTDLEKKANKAK